MKVLLGIIRLKYYFLVLLLILLGIFFFVLNLLSQVEKFASMKSLINWEVSNSFIETPPNKNSDSDSILLKTQKNSTTIENSPSHQLRYEEEEMEEELYKEDESMDEMERKSSPSPLKKHWQLLNNEECAVDILILTYPRENVKYSYLSSSVSSIFNELESTIFKPCITVFNTLPDTIGELESAISENILNSGRFRIIENQISSSIFTSHLMTAQKRNHANNFHDMIKMFMALSDATTTTSNRNVILMEDDFMFCKECSSHLVNIFNLATNGLEDYSGIRFSFGLNGIVIQKRDIPSLLSMCERYGFRNFPIDSLLEEFLSGLNGYGKSYFGSRKFYTYRFQLMQHIGLVSAVGNNRNEREYEIAFPNCYETIVHAGLLNGFKLDECPDSLFSPCNSNTNSNSNSNSNSNGNSNNNSNSNKGMKNVQERFVHDIYEMPIKTPTHRYNLATLKDVDSVLCREGEDCSTCCRMRYSTCRPEFFPYINHCDEMKRLIDDGNPQTWCKCRVETMDGESVSPSIQTMRNECTVGYRPSRFKCENKPPAGSGIRRVCPCQKKRRPPNPLSS